MRKLVKQSCLINIYMNRRTLLKNKGSIPGYHTSFNSVFEDMVQLYDMDVEGVENIPSLPTFIFGYVVWDNSTHYGPPTLLLIILLPPHFDKTLNGRPAISLVLLFRLFHEEDSKLQGMHIAG